MFLILDKTLQENERTITLLLRLTKLSTQLLALAASSLVDSSMPKAFSAGCLLNWNIASIYLTTCKFGPGVIVC